MTDQPTSKLLIAEPPLQVLPSLAVRIGLNESIFVQQLHYLLIQPKLGKQMDGKKWLRNSLQEWHAIFPFWAINTIRAIIQKLIDNKIVLEQVPDGRCTWYAIDYENLDKKTIKTNKAKRADRPNFGQSMKKHRKNIRHDPDSRSSMIQSLDTSKTSPKTPDNSSERVLSSELAGQASTPVTAAPSNPKERQMLQTLQKEGVTVARTVEEHRVECALAEKGLAQPISDTRGIKRPEPPQSPTNGKGLDDSAPFPDHAAITTLQGVLQQTFLDGVATPEPPPPHAAPPPAPALPEVPTFKPGDLVWWNPARNQRTLCGTQPLVKAVVFSVTAKRVQINFKGVHDGCLHPSSVKPENLRVREAPERDQWEITASNLAARAAAPSAKAGRTKKPPLKQPDKPIKDALALLMFGGVDLVNGSWALIVRLWNDLECPPLAKVQKLVAYWPHDWRVAKNPTERPSVAVIKTIWDVAQHWTVPGETPAIDCTDDGEEF